MRDLVLCLMGPTASGKTDLVFELFASFPLEIISVDSALIYREMDIGTAKPTPAELEKTPHHLINIVDPIDSYSAAQFCEDAIRLCKEIQLRGNIPLLAGGTMMYFNALQNGLSVLPEVDEALRKKLNEEVLQQGLTALYQQLQQLDPITAQRIHPHDAQRIQRALEVYYTSGKPLSVHLQEGRTKSPFHFLNLALFPEDRAWLHARIAQRFETMLQAGLVEEVQALQKHWHLNAQMPSMRCVGYRQVLEFLQNDYGYEKLREKGIAATRQLAKRQLTWLRGWQDACYFDPQSKTCYEEIKSRIREIA